MSSATISGLGAANFPFGQNGCGVVIRDDGKNVAYYIAVMTFVLRVLPQLIVITSPKCSASILHL